MLLLRRNNSSLIIVLNITEYNFIGKMATKYQLISFVLLVTIILGTDFIVGFTESKSLINTLTRRSFVKMLISDNMCTYDHDGETINQPLK